MASTLNTVALDDASHSSIMFVLPPSAPSAPSSGRICPSQPRSSFTGISDERAKGFLGGGDVPRRNGERVRRTPPPDWILVSKSGRDPTLLTFVLLLPLGKLVQRRGWMWVVFVVLSSLLVVPSHDTGLLNLHELSLLQAGIPADHLSGYEDLEKAPPRE
ncbi:hypothetical protein AARAC_003609 [Aspergillus arachidicola]|uniref:Uncharacterized protein n=1 Tax=Aspergillus arachidicola TaxID=656916 RepID=A0A2G7FEE0_9EURO|nr:hypothetical protein AARAC_003609 [Aspergillus arachidicola]